MKSCQQCGKRCQDDARFCARCGVPLSADIERSTSSGRVVVTGLGAITPLGLNVEQTWEGLLAGRSGVDRLTLTDPEPYACKIAAEVRGFEPREFMDAREARRVARASQFAIAAARMAIADAGLDLSKEDRSDVGVVIGTALGGALAEAERAYRVLWSKGPNSVSPFFLTAMPPNMPTYHISNIFDLTGYSSTITTACAAGTQAIGEAAELIRAGRASVVLSGGCEATFSEFLMAGFCVAKALSTRNDEPARAMRPFDRDRDGFVCGEGGAVLILESLEHAQARRAHIYGEVLGYGANSDGYHPIAPKPDGEGAARAMEAALADAGLRPEDIDAINAHGTSTPLGDIAETLAVKKAFGEAAYRVPMNSTKSMIAHLIGGAGAIEAVASLLSLRDQILHPTINYETADPECDLDYVPNHARRMKLDRIMTNSFGMGSQNASLILGRWTESSGTTNNN